MCFMHTFRMELECTIYYLSPDPFCYVISKPFQANVNQSEIKKLSSLAVWDINLNYLCNRKTWV